MNISLYIILFLALFFSACVSSPKVKNKEIEKEKAWINDPYLDDGKVRSIGCAKIHYNGTTHQKKLALSNALDEMATQLNTTVENVALRNKFYTNGLQKSSSFSETSLHKVDKVNLSVSILDYYKKSNGEICVWIVQN